MPRRDARAYLFDVVEACDVIVEYTRSASLEDYERDKGLRSIVERQLFIVGEAVVQIKRLEPLSVHTLGEVEQIIKVRNILAHIYFGVKHDLIWDIVQKHVRPLRESARAWLEQLERESS